MNRPSRISRSRRAARLRRIARRRAGSRNAVRRRTSRGRTFGAGGRRTNGARTNRFARLVTVAVDRLHVAPLRRVMPLQTFRYAACGGLNMAVDTLLYYLVFNCVFGQREVDLGFFVLSAKMAALAVVFPITFFNGFWLNRNVAFRRSPLRGRVQIFRYMLSVGGSILLTVAFLKFFTEAFHIWATPSKVVTTLLTAVYSYLMQKYYTFRGCEAENA